MEENLEPIGELKMREPQKLEQCEWVFQFDADEPQIFAWTSEDMKDEEPVVTFTISNTKDAYVSFTNRITGKTFKLFARELTKEGMEMREYQNKLNDEFKKDLENASENKEA
jgi:predicted HTH domain antitoxin